jgi:sterol desaturase/sphingolipid hydroxylase (fatty acid hydroxylase superfamily)
MGLLFLVGFVSWTLIEYLLHRFVFHFHPTTELGQRVHFLVHGIHHDYPNDSKRLVMPPMLSAPLASVFFVLFYALFGFYFGLDLFAGMITGYLIYDMMHYALHHISLDNPMFKDLKEHHMIHHFQDPEHGFGVSSKMWDYIFRTTFNVQKKSVVVEGEG